MASRTYIAFLEEGPEGYGVFFADVPGCVSAGDTLDEAVANAKEALSLHLDGMVDDNAPLPEARSLQEIARGGDLPDGRFVYASVTAEVDEGERVNVYLPKSLLAQIKLFGDRTGIDNRSTFLRLAARHYLTNEREGKTLKVKAGGGLSGVRAVPRGKKASA